MSGSRIDGQPVGQRLFSGLGTLMAPRPGTAPSARALAEQEMIARLYGRLPPITPDFVAGLGGAQIPAPPLPVALPGGRVPPAARPGGGRLDPLLMVPPLTLPPEIDPSNEPRTPPDRPQDRAVAVPQTPAEANFMPPQPRPGSAADEQWLAMLRGAAAPNRDMLDMNEEELLRRSGQRTATRGEPIPREAATPQETSGPGTAPGDPPPTGEGNPAVAGVARTRYPRFEGNEPDFTESRAAFERSRPGTRERDPEERMLRLIASALAGGMRETGVGVAGGASAGLGAGYARESDRDEALWRQDEEARVTFERGLAGLLGQQEQAAFNNAIARQGFDRTSMIAEDQDARARETLGIQRANLAQNTILRQLRMQALLQQGGMAAEPANILSRGIQQVIANPGTQILIPDERGGMVPLTFNIGGQERTLGQLRAELTAQRGQAGAFRNNPLFATNPGMAQRIIDDELAGLLMERFRGLSSAQQSAVLRQLLPLTQNRARAGSQTLATDE